jgi:hypothetical protein
MMEAGLAVAAEKAIDGDEHIADLKLREDIAIDLPKMQQPADRFVAVGREIDELKAIDLILPNETYGNWSGSDQLHYLRLSFRTQPQFREHFFRLTFLVLGFYFS